MVLYFALSKNQMTHVFENCNIIFFVGVFIGSYFRVSLVLQVLDVVCHNWGCIFLFHLGTIPLSTYMKVYKVGDYVDIKVRLLLKIEI